MNCNVKDICLSFLYMQSLENKGLLNNVSSEVKAKMVEDSLKKLKRLAVAREKVLEFRKGLGEYPAINVISKDYGNYLNFEEAYSKAIEKQGLYSSVYDFDVRKDLETRAKDEEGYAYVSPILGQNIVANYEDRDNQIITMIDITRLASFVYHSIRNAIEEENIISLDEEQENIIATLGSHP